MPPNEHWKSTMNTARLADQTVSMHVKLAKITPAFLAYGHNDGGDYAEKISHIVGRSAK